MRIFSGDGTVRLGGRTFIGVSFDPFLGGWA